MRVSLRGLHRTYCVQVRFSAESRPAAVFRGVTSSDSSIEQFGQSYQGDIVYAVVLKLNQPDPRLRWNMTATVTFGNTK